jgi:hypothetical protein
VYVLTSALSGTIFSFALIVLLSAIFGEFSYHFKLLLIIVISLTYSLKEFGLLSIPLPELRWQIPSSWVRFSPVTNMLVWGTILGAGLFTYHRYSGLFILYLYLGLFHQPSVAAGIGLTYGFSRALASVVAAWLWRPTREQLFMNDSWWQSLPTASTAHGVLLSFLLLYTLFSNISVILLN